MNITKMKEDKGIILEKVAHSKLLSSLKTEIQMKKKEYRQIAG